MGENADEERLDEPCVLVERLLIVFDESSDEWSLAFVLRSASLEQDPSDPQPAEIGTTDVVLVSMVIADYGLLLPICFDPTGNK